ncbi:MAG: NAD-dependent epimerase/dehydratase family protein [Pirellulaceae bacterium]
MQRAGKGIPVLVTGSAGRIGQAACDALRARGHWVRGFDLHPSPNANEAILGDLANLETMSEAMDGIQVVIHLAATPDDDNFMQRLLPNNIVGVHNVLEAARQVKVSRVLLASSGQVVMGHPGPFPITPETPTSPRNWYAAAKVLSEVAGQIYAHVHAMEIIVARLGWCPRDRQHVEELAQNEVGQDVYLSPRDAGRFFVCAAEAQLDKPYCIVFATSRPYRQTRYDIAPTRELLGYEPLDTWPAGTEEPAEQR